MGEIDLDRAYGTLGHTTNAELRLLAKYAKLVTESDPASVVELGVYLGRSLIALALSAAIKPVVGVDMFTDAHLFSPGGPQGGFEYRKENRDICVENIERAGLRVREDVLLIQATTLDAAKNWSAPIGLLFVDADHREEPLRADLAAWTPYIVQGGYLALHDYNDHEWGVTTCARELEASGEWEQVDGVHSLIVYRRISAPAKREAAPVQAAAKPAAKAKARAR